MHERDGLSHRFKKLQPCRSGALSFSYRHLPWLGHTDLPRGSHALLVQRASDADQMDTAVQLALRGLEPRHSFIEIENLGEALAPQIRPCRLGASVFTAFGVLATIFAMFGLWSSVAYAVSLRTSEFAIRKAVGAGGGSLGRMMLQNVYATVP